MERRRALLATLGLHLAAAVAHGGTHAVVPVPLAAWQNAVVLLTTFLGPVAGVALALREHPFGLPLFTVAMVGALGFGLTHHFLLENPDNVAAVTGSWRLPFGATALAVLVTDALGVAVGGWYWRAR